MKAKISKWDLIKLRSFYTKKGNRDTQKITYGMEQSVCKWGGQQRIEFQNIPTIHTTWYQTNRWATQTKMDRFKQMFKRLPAAAAAKSLQSYPTLCNPIDGNSPGSPVHTILQAGILEWVAISFSNAWKWKVKVKSPSCVWLFATPWTAADQAPPSMGFSRQEYWNGVPLPSPKTVTTQFQYLL